MVTITSGIRLGILGGGQLGRMSAIAAAQLGITVTIYTPEENSPASLVTAETIVAEYNDQKALKDFASKTDFITYEFENIPVDTIDYLTSLKACIFPDRKLLDVAQDRLKEKAFLNSLGIETAQWSAVSSTDDVTKIAAQWKTDGFILKTTRFGYDGKGQIKGSASKVEEISSFLQQHKNNALIIESLVPFASEISVIVARDKSGKTVSYGPMLNEHKNHILHQTIVPSGLNPSQEKQAINMAIKVADAVNLIGVLTVEFFVCTDGRILANEIAPRTHNSGHWTIDACAVSQFEQHVRTVCGLPVGDPTRHSDATMLNLIGDDIIKSDEYLKQPNACLHLYGKHEARPGRKMGHVTFLKSIV